MKKKILSVVGIIIVIAIAYGLFHYFTRPNPLLAFKLPTPKVAVSHIQKRNIPLTISALAQVKSLRNIKLAAQQSGYVSLVNVKSGQTVKKGQLLFSINSKAQNAEVASARATYNQAKEHLARFASLLKVGAISKDTYDTNFEALKTAKATLVEKEKTLEDTNVKAPFSGRVTYTNLAQGSFVNVGDPLIGMVSDNGLELQYELPAKFLALAKPGQDVTFKTDLYPSKVLQASVNYVAPSINTVDHAFTVRAVVKTDAPLLEPGLSVMATQTLIKHRPVDALQGITLKGDPNGLYVFVVNKENKILDKRVSIGFRSGAWVEVKSGLTQKDRVVVEGQNRVHEGQTIVVAS